MVAALGWGALAASSLVLGVILAFLRPWPTKLVGLVLAFGAGALISAVSFSLTDEGFDVGDEWAVGVGLALGALVYYAAGRVLASRSGGTGGGDTGSELALGSFLDGIPEQFVLGVGLAGGQGISVALLLAIFVSNLPEGVGAAIDMEAAGTERRKIMRLFVIVGVISALSAGVGFGVADSISGNVQAGVDGFAAGALLVMLIDSMIPEAREKGGQAAGLLAVLGFAVATALANA
jgi:ZIP family zinc transporter